MDFEEFLRRAKEVSKHNPARVCAEVHDEMIRLEVNGSGLDLMELSMQIALEIMDKTHMEIEDYCEILSQAAIAKNISKKYGRGAKYIIRDLFGKGDKKDE